MPGRRAILTLLLCMILSAPCLAEGYERSSPTPLADAAVDSPVAITGDVATTWKGDRVYVIQKWDFQVLARLVIEPTVAPDQRDRKRCRRVAGSVARRPANGHGPIEPRGSGERLLPRRSHRRLRGLDLPGARAVPGLSGVPSLPIESASGYHPGGLTGRPTGGTQDGHVHRTLGLH